MTMLERENVRKSYTEWARTEKANKSMMSGSSPTESQKQMITDRIEIEKQRIDNLISSLKKLKEKLQTESENTETHYTNKVSEIMAKKL